MIEEGIDAINDPTASKPLSVDVVIDTGSGTQRQTQKMNLKV